MKTRNHRFRRSALRIMAAGLAALVTGCTGEVTPDVVAGVDGCGECGMVIDRVNESCGWIDDGGFEPFCSPGCLLSKYDDNRAAGVEIPSSIFFSDYQGSGFSPAATTAFLLTDHVPTVMNSRVITFSSIAAAETMQRHDDETTADWTGYRVLRGRPDRVVETVFSAAGMEPESVTVAKDDIVLWRVTGDGLGEDLTFQIRGYPEVAPATVSSGGGTTELRFLATRPGAGFPIESSDGDGPLGMLKVTGAHTADEAAR